MLYACVCLATKSNFCSSVFSICFPCQRGMETSFVVFSAKINPWYLEGCIDHDRDSVIAE